LLHNTFFWKLRLIISVLVLVILSFLFIVVLYMKTPFLHLKSVNSFSLQTSTYPSDRYKTETHSCYLNKDHTRLLRDKNLHIVQTRNIVQESKTASVTFAYVKRMLDLKRPMDINVEIKLYPCQIIRLYVNLKKWAGNLNTDKKVIQFMYEALSVTTLFGIRVNGSEDNLKYAMAKLYYSIHYKEDSGNNPEVWKEKAINMLEKYKNQYLRNDMNLDNDETLFAHYVILQGLRQYNSLSKEYLNKFSGYKVFEMFKSNLFYSKLMNASNNGEKAVKLTFHYIKTNSDEEYYSILSF